MRASLIVILGSVLLLAAEVALPQVDVRLADASMFPADTRYDPAIPTPEGILGFALGHQPVRHHQLVDYITRVAEQSDRLALEVIGYSHERRPILFLVATSPGNHSRLDSIRAEHAALTEPGGQARVSDDMPGVTWLNFGVHGAEASGMDASLPFVYHLAAAQGAEIERILDETVILVTAIFNPDGHAQRVAWIDAFGGRQAIADPAHIEHQFSWQFARTNHYWFDLNRQWLLLTQPEPRAWMRKWHEWRPNLTVDYHEMSSESTYYFHPGVATRTNPLVPDRAEDLMAQTVRTSEDFLDGEGRLYFQGENFDNYYIGKGSTFPLLNGGIGVLYEAGATLGREIETTSGLRTYREMIRNHFRTAIASIEAGANLKGDYLRYQADFYAGALREAERADARAWVVSARGDTARLDVFAELLSSHRIAAYRPTRDIAVDGRTFAAADSLVVPTSQPQYRLIRSIFESVSEFEDATFYDVSTWVLPPAFGLDFAALGPRELRAGLLGETWAQSPLQAAAPDESSYAYVFEWGPYYAPRALQRVFEAGLLARVAGKPFAVMTTKGSRNLPRGSIVVPLDRQPRERADIHELMKTIAAQDGLTVHALTSGRSTTGSTGINIGGPSVRPIEGPDVLLVVGDGINLYDAGEIWHLADYRMQMPITLRRRDALGDIDWNRYTHIVFPGGDYDEYEAAFAERLRLWVHEGGTAIGIRDAAPWLRAATLDWVDPESEEALDAAEEEQEEDAAEAERLAYSDKDDYEAGKVIGGAIFAADLDTSHPLGFGYAERAIYLHKNVEEPFLPTENPFGTVIAYSDDPVFSGFVSAENQEALAGTPALIAERSGDGSIILFADNPNFRGYWYGTNKLFLNALFFSTVFEAPEDD
ncbi:MAG: peptidase [Gammaproteobacteria bacterium]|nr:peptidase [Gammaproteobacteria bacterium]